MLEKYISLAHGLDSFVLTRPWTREPLGVVPPWKTMDIGHAMLARGLTQIMVSKTRRKCVEMF